MPLSPDFFPPTLRLALACAVAAGLGGCSHLQNRETQPAAPVVAAAPPVQLAPAPPPPPLAPDPQALADAAARRLLAFHDRLRDLPVADLPKEQARLEALRSSAETSDPAESAAATLELALVLSQTRSNGDLARALALTEALTRAGAPTRWQPMARLLQTRLADQRRLEEQAERQAQQLRDQQRRLEQVSSQLEALKAIERSLSARPAAQAPAAPGAVPAPTAPRPPP